jgi:FkbM family methyltransferase
MAEAHMLIAPSRYEGFGYPAAEAMARGLPVFASDVAAFREFVPQDWRFPLDDPAVLASMIDGLDAAGLSTMSDAAPKAVARFSPENHRKRHRELFTGLVSASRVADRPPINGSEWRPGGLARARSLVRRALIGTLGDGAEARVRAEYHRVLRRVGRFGPPEDAATSAVLAAVAANSRTILDIGANVGRYAWFLRNHAPSGSRLYALEPHPGAARLLRAALGPLPGCTVLEVAAADRDGVAELVVPGGPFGASVSALSWVRTDGRDAGQPVLPITTRRLDGLIEDGTVSIAAPLFMKIDVEGAEARVLRGAAGLLARHTPVVYFECQASSAARQGETPQGVWRELERAGYRIFATSSAGFVRVAQVQPDVANYLAIPGENEVEGDQPLDAAALIAIVGRWASRATEA